MNGVKIHFSRLLIKRKTFDSFSTFCKKLEIIWLWSKSPQKNMHTCIYSTLWKPVIKKHSVAAGNMPINETSKRCLPRWLCRCNFFPLLWRIYIKILTLLSANSPFELARDICCRLILANIQFECQQDLTNKSKN